MLRLLLIVVLINLLFSCEDNTFKNKKINIKYKNNDISYSVWIGECNELKEKLKYVEKLYISYTPIECLQSNLLVNLTDLNEVYFYKTSTKIVQKDAFFNLKNLKKLSLIYNNLTFLLEDNFKNLPVDELSLSHNDLTFLQKNAFNNLPFLKVLNLNNNKLKEWNPKWLMYCRSLKSINLHGNAIENLPANAFEEFPALKEINLSRNNLKILNNGLFSGLINLNKLDLSWNRIRIIERDVFEPFKNLTGVFNRGIFNLHLNSNNLTFLYRDVLEDLILSKKISLFRNPLQCSCYQEIIKFFRIFKIELDFDDIRCTKARFPVCAAVSIDSKLCSEKWDEDLAGFYYRNYPEEVEDDYDCYKEKDI